MKTSYSIFSIKAYSFNQSCFYEMLLLYMIFNSVQEILFIQVYIVLAHYLLTLLFNILALLSKQTLNYYKNVIKLKLIIQHLAALVL